MDKLTLIFEDLCMLVHSWMKWNPLDEGKKSEGFDFYLIKECGFDKGNRLIRLFKVINKFYGEI